ncbi:phosphotransferase [Flectobacillus major]|uniref:phosphotransferase n=1 Tax=Flectobacillus major TaxID=103 RepID=UPI0003F6B62A|nr:phosphotransferase [Flectobacillus major]
MNVVPVSSSIIDAAYLSTFLPIPYSLDNNTVCQLIKAGINHTYLVDTGTHKYIFRIYSYNWRSITEINEEVNLLNLLHAKQIPISFAIPDLQGLYIQTFNAPEGPRFGVLFSFAEGEKILSFSEEIHYKIGETMAQIHQVTESLELERVTYSSEVLLVNSIQQTERFLSEDTDEMQFLRTTQQILLHTFDNLPTHGLRRGIVHLDIWFDNLNIAQDQITIFDFDFCGNGYLCMDIGYYILQIYSTETDEQTFRSKCQHFLAGYESVQKISAEEKAVLQAFATSIYFFYLGVQCQRYENWSNVFLNEVHLKRLIQLRIKRWFDLSFNLQDHGAKQ